MKLLFALILYSNFLQLQSEKFVNNVFFLLQIIGLDLME